MGIKDKDKTKESLSIRFLYCTAPGRMILALLVNPWISKAAALFLSSGASAFLIPGFIKRHGIDMKDCEVPDRGYRSFNDFFIRKKKDGSIKIPDCSLISPCDGFLSVCEINDSSIFRIKNVDYSVADLLHDRRLAKRYDGGIALIFRLTPAHYHRYLFCTTGTVMAKRKIRGRLHSVRPVCHENFRVFVENSREYTIIRSRELGDVIQMEIGALLVGKISNHIVKMHDEAVIGNEKGYFEFGGSSIVILLRKGTSLNDGIINGYPGDGEIPVSAGQNLISDSAADTRV